MVYAKTNLFNDQLQETARLFKALAHPARLQIIQYLAETRTCITGDISEHLPLGRTTVNQHLAELKAAGLIIGTVKGARTNYCLNPEAVRKLKKLANEFLAGIECNSILNC
ncbi:MAG: ArsR/SmtB family transcription factor [Bacteroidales bacterium]